MKDREKYEVHLAPLQGYTDAVYRNHFASFFGGVTVYYTPFIRMEAGGKFRNKDLREIDPLRNSVPILVPQILPGTAEEFYTLAQGVVEKGYRRIDINLGCPFPMVTGKKKGAGMLPYPERVREVLSPLNDFPEIAFSVKMRLGMEDVSEGVEVLKILNDLRLDYISVHARTGRQQYKGLPDVEAFERFYTGCSHPLFYNGDLKMVGQIEMILSRFPLLRGVMIGRGVLSSPFLAKDFYQTETFSAEERIKVLEAFEKALFSDYEKCLEGENQLLSKMQSLWEYFMPEVDRKCRKRILKARRVSDYRAAVGDIFHSEKG